MAIKVDIIENKPELVEYSDLYIGEFFGKNGKITHPLSLAQKLSEEQYLSYNDMRIYKYDRSVMPDIVRADVIIKVKEIN